MGTDADNIVDLYNRHANARVAGYCAGKQGPASKLAGLGPQGSFPGGLIRTRRSVASWPTVAADFATDRGRRASQLMGAPRRRTWRAVIQPQAAAFWLSLRDFQPLPSPDPLHPLGVHQPASVAQQGRDPPVAVAAVSLGQLDDIGGQRQLVIAAAGGLALGPSGVVGRRGRLVVCRISHSTQ